MEELRIRDVPFHGATLKAAQDQNGTIWAGVRWMCDGIGLTKHQRDRQIANIQSDIVLKQGASNLRLPTSGGTQNVFCLHIDYVPLWLAKISITPTMQRESPEVVEKLVTYQLKAKDALAAAFIHKTADPSGQIEALRQEMNERFQTLNESLGQAFEVLFRSQHITSLETNGHLIESDRNIPVQLSNDRDYLAWKKQVYSLASEVVKYDHRYTQNRAVLSAAYYRMRDVYGFVQSQAEKEYMYRHGVQVKPATIDVIYDDKTYRTILVPVLETMLSESKQMGNEKRMDNIIYPLVEITEDKSPHHCVIYKKVFGKMAADGLVSWQNRITRYQRAHCTKRVPNKKAIIAESPKLMRKFEQTVSSILDSYKAGVAK